MTGSVSAARRLAWEARAERRALAGRAEMDAAREPAESDESISVRVSAHYYLTSRPVFRIYLDDGQIDDVSHGAKPPNRIK